MLSTAIDTPIASEFGFVELPHDEELPVTIHVGMIGSDGILLAGDIWTYTNVSSVPETMSVWGAEAVSKITVFADGDLAISRAHDMRQARKVSEALGEQLTREHWENPESKIESIAMATLADEPVWRGVHCLIAVRNPLSLFKLECGKEPSTDKNICVCNRSLGYAFGGDAHNPATFWATRYLLTDDTRSRTVDDLIPLAAQIAVDAGSITNGSIRGLELVSCGESGFARLPDATSRAWRTEAVKRSEKIRKLITAPLRHAASNS